MIALFDDLALNTGDERVGERRLVRDRAGAVHAGDLPRGHHSVIAVVERPLLGVLGTERKQRHRGAGSDPTARDMNTPECAEPEHPPQRKPRNQPGAEGSFDMTGTMLITFLFSLLTFTFIFADLLWHRIRLGRLADKVEQLKMKTME